MVGSTRIVPLLRGGTYETCLEVEVQSPNSEGQMRDDGVNNLHQSGADDQHTSEEHEEHVHYLIMFSPANRLLSHAQNRETLPILTFAFPNGSFGMFAPRLLLHLAHTHYYPLAMTE